MPRNKQLFYWRYYFFFTFEPLNNDFYIKMKKLITFLCLGFSLGIGNFVNAQGIINAGLDTAICLPGTANLHASIGNQNPIILSSYPGQTLNDDQFDSTAINLGFNFTYFGNTYSQCLVSTNNYITFTIGGTGGNPGGGSPWSITGPIPGGPTNTWNAIMAPWQDIQPVNGGVIRYATTGTAPNRIFVVEYCNVPMYSCLQMQFSSQIQLFEGSNKIESHIISKPICSTWNSGQAIHGIQNIDGTIAFVNAGRNAGVQWSANNEGTRFDPDPNDPNNYFITNIPFSPVTLGASGTITWSVAGGGNIGTGSNITVSPTVPTSYVASISDLCSGFTYHDTVNVNAAPTPDLSFVYPSATFCAGSTNAIPTLGVGSVGDFSASPTGLVFANNTTGEIDLTASTPGTYTIIRVGSNPGGCIDTLPVQITITNAPDPNHSYSSAVYCQGGIVPAPVFTQGASAGLFTSSPAGLVFNNANTGEIDVANSAPGTYTITNTISGFGCPTTVDTSTVTIAQQLIEAGPPISTCTGAGVLIQGLATGPNSGSVTWSGGSGTFTSPNNDTTYYNPGLNDAGVPFVNLTLTMTGTAACPTVFDQVPITVEIGALANAGADQNFCDGNPAPITINGIVGGLGTSGTWSTNGTGSFGNANALSTIYTPSADDVTNGGVVIYFTSTPSSGNCPPAIDSLLVTYSVQPTISIQIPNSVCAGSNINLTAVTSGTVSSYQWITNGSGTFTSQTSVSTQYTPSAADITNGSVNFTLSAVAPAPCSSVMSQAVVTIIPAPTVSFAGGGVVQTGTGTSCPNGTSAPVTLTMNGAGPFNLTYTVGGDTISVNNISSPFVYQDSIPGAFNIVTLNDTGACPGIITGSAVIDTVNLRYLALAQAETCGEQNGTAVATSVTGGNQPYTYLWNNATASTNDSISDLLSGTYSVTVTDANNCTATQSVFVPQVLGVVASIEGSPMSGQYPLNVTFTNNSTGALTYQWNFGDGDSSSIMSPSHIFEVQGSYQVVLTAYNTSECFTSDTLTIVVDGEVPNIFTPNGDGSNDKFMINRLSVKSFTGQIFNRWGKKVYEWTDPKQGWDGGNSEPGVYFYIVDLVNLKGENEQLHGTVTLMK